MNKTLISIILNADFFKTQVFEKVIRKTYTISASVIKPHGYLMGAKNRNDFAAVYLNYFAIAFCRQEIKFCIHTRLLYKVNN